MINLLTWFPTFKGRKIMHVQYHTPKTTFEQVLEFSAVTLVSAKSALNETWRTWTWQQSFMLLLLLAYILFTVLTVVRARRVYYTRMRDLRHRSLEQLKLELEELLEEGRAELRRLELRNKFTLTGVDHEDLDLEDAEVDGVARDWHWREVRDQILRQQRF